MRNVRKLGTVGGGTINRMQTVNMLDSISSLKRMNGITPGRPVEYVLLNKSGFVDMEVIIRVHDDGKIKIESENNKFTMSDLFDLMPREAQEEMIWKMDTVV